MEKKFLKFNGGANGAHKTFRDYGFNWVRGDVREVEEAIAKEASKTFPDLFSIVEEPVGEPKGAPIENLDNKEFNPDSNKGLDFEEDSNKGTEEV